MVGKRAGGGPGEYLGTRLDGGERRPLRAGDIPHPRRPFRTASSCQLAQHITYVLVKFPAK